MLRSSYPKSQFSQKILAIFLCAVVLLSSLGISAQPAAAQTVPEDAEFEWRVIFPHLTASGWGFLQKADYAVSLIQDHDRKTEKEIGTVKTESDGTFFYHKKLDKSWTNSKPGIYFLCLENKESGHRECRPLNLGRFLFQSTNQCTPPRFDNKYADLFR